MTKKEMIEHYKKEATWETYPKGTGGQHVTVCRAGVTLICRDVGFELTVDFYRSQIKNKELTLTLFELYLEETLKD